MNIQRKVIPSESLVLDSLANVLQNSMLLRVTFIFVSWLLVWQIGRVVEYTEHASVWFPPSGFTFSCLLVLGRRAFLPILAAAIVTTIWNGHHYNLPLNIQQLVWGGFLFGVAHILPYWLGAGSISRLANNKGHSIPKLIVVFILIAGISAFITTILVLASLVYSKQMNLSEVNSTLLPFWIGDMAGVIVLVPLFSALLIRIFPSPNIELNEFRYGDVKSYKLIAGKLSLNVILIIFTMLLAYFTKSFESSFAIFFLAVTHMWIATTESPIVNIISLAVSSTLIVVLTHYLDLMDNVMVYQFAINVVAANSLFGIAIPQMKAYNQELETMVYTDTLTKVSSRHYMIQRAELEISESQENQQPLTMVVFDLDNFKIINDTWGHSAGDDTLVKVCKTVKSFLHSNDVFARFGGDEFVLLLPGMTKQNVKSLMQEIKNKIQSIEINGSGLTSSFGVAELEKGEDFKSMFHRADQALYASKEAGRNRITVAF